jgi:hypothetical protein
VRTPEAMSEDMQSDVSQGKNTDKHEKQVQNHDLA